MTTNTRAGRPITMHSDASRLCCRLVAVGRSAWLAAALVVFCLLGACASTHTYVAPVPGGGGALPPPESEVAYRVFLAGNVGAKPDAPAALALLRERLALAGDSAAVVFLGDNVSHCGLPDSGAVDRTEAEAALRAMAAAVEGFGGRVVVLPGDRDWNCGRPAGLEAVLRQERFVEALLGREDAFLPAGGFPGPVELPLADGLVLLVLDTQWWLTDGERPFGDTGDYELDEAGDFLLQLEDAMRRHEDAMLLVVGHHPLFSNGPHGGNFPLRHHLFPLTARYPGAYVPLPIAGSTYPLYRRYVGTTQDLTHGRYQSLRSALADRKSGIFARHERLVYAGAHDRSLQHFDEGSRHYLVSGAVATADYVARGRGAALAAARPGFLVVQYYRDGSAWLEAWAADEAEGRVLYRRMLFPPMPERIDPGRPADSGTAYPDYRDSVKVIAANPAYAAGPVKRFFFGRLHRDAWATPVSAPYLDLERTAGGLTPIKRGGGQQTRSLRLRGGDGREYVLRSIDKDPSRTVPVQLQGTIATDLVQDGIAYLHPYAAYIIPQLADAAGVYHTHPRLVYVPDDPRLGIYRADFGGRLMMFEERPDDDMGDMPGYGGANDVVGPGKLYEELNGDNDHRVDQLAFARARLFDMLLGDWDRHRDQWRWAAFEPFELDSTLQGDARTQGKIYRPIPRDRDAAFNRIDGVFMSMLPYVLPKFQDFDDSYGYLKGLTTNGLEQDRRFTSELTRQDWIALGEDLKRRLTDDVIEAAFQSWPEPVFRLHGPRMIEIFKRRRDQLPEVAERVYRLMARVVDVVGSNKHEQFEVRRLLRGETEVAVYKTTKKGEVGRLLYHRVFLPDETKEIRLYGQDGNDRFILNGDARAAILVTIVGGEGEDVFVDSASARGSRRTRIYDTIEGNTWETKRGVKTIRSSDPLVNRYDSRAYAHDFETPVAYFGYNQDDGLYLGGGARFVRHGFRKTPYASQHVLRANFAAAPGAFNIRYDGHYVGIGAGWDGRLKLDWLSPNSILNFYGLGNETQRSDGDAKYYQANLRRIDVAPAVERRLGAGFRFSVGPHASFVNVRFDSSRFVGQPQDGISETSFDDHAQVGLDVGLDVNTSDSRVNPTQGFHWTSTADVRVGVHGTRDRYTHLATSLALYLSPTLSPQVTLALRVGAAHNEGAFPFYDAVTLGGRENLRGYRGTRFAGRTSVYQNVDLRVKLVDVSTYIVLGQAGLVAFLDNGRVWTDGEGSAVWHQGYGGGLWMSLFDAAVITATHDRSVEERTFTLRLGFLF